MKHYIDPITNEVFAFEEDGSQDAFIPPRLELMTTPWPPLPTLEEVKALRVEFLNISCSTEIVSGFFSSALGSDHTYPSTVIDQNNMAVNVLSSLYPSLPEGWTTPQLCADSSGVWQYRMHTAAQIQTVGSDGKSKILALLIKKAGLQGQVMAAGTIEEVQSIVW